MSLITEVINFYLREMKNLKFKRKKSGGGSNWGEGLDYLLKNNWNELDKLVEDNYFGRHNLKLINSLVPAVLTALKKSISVMKKECPVDAGLKDWIKKANKIASFGKLARKASDKVIFIDATTQFLRETSVKDSPKKILKKKGKGKSFKNPELKGLVVSKSSSLKLRGIVKVILSGKDFKKIKKGEILVATETNANFLPVMKKSRAFITDFGGLLCHAAIVARELKKPCIIGTKIATKILKDGDRIEMDLNKGIVKILK